MSHTFQRWLLAVALAGAGLSAHGSEGLAAGMIKRVSGTVTVVRAGAELPASPGMPLRQGDRVVTGATGGVGIVLADDSRVTAGPGSQVEVRDVQFDATTQEGNIVIRLFKGVLHMVTGLIGRQKPENVRIETPTAVMGVRGTEFIVSSGAGS